MALLFNVNHVAYDLLERFGDQAVSEARKMAGEAAARDDSDLEESWAAVANAVAALDSKLPKLPE